MSIEPFGDNDSDQIDENTVAVAFGALEDPRINRRKLYPLSEIFFLSLAAALVGVKSWRGVETFGHERSSGACTPSSLL